VRHEEPRERRERVEQEGNPELIRLQGAVQVLRPLVLESGALEELQGTLCIAFEAKLALPRWAIAPALAVLPCPSLNRVSPRGVEPPWRCRSPPSVLR